LTLTCTSCEAPISLAPVFDDGRAFCCSGCAVGGPCLCEYGAAADSPAADAEPTGPPAAAGPQAPPSRGEPRATLLRISGFRDQQELLAFGLALEERPEVGELALVRARLDDCWFAVGVADPPTLARVLGELREYDIAAEAQAAGVDARMHASASGRASLRPVSAPLVRDRLGPAEPAADGAPLLLPARPRFRLQAVGTRAAAAAEPAPPALARGSDAAAAAPDVVRADERPGGAAPIREHLTLVASPFRSFVALAEFQDAVRALPGVTDIRVRRFYRGTLQLAVDYDDVLPFSARLRELAGFRWTLVSESADQLQLTLDGEPDELAAHG
jgi:hypothetical protein